uniref:Ribosomal protein L41 n=1 Tax=Timema bartmani TaxID=61472 RepID=A0A7R9FFN0_9NEOP|nr:unnamed protein product [Timema bartmani]
MRRRKLTKMMMIRKRRKRKKGPRWKTQARRRKVRARRQ